LARVADGARTIQSDGCGWRDGWHVLGDAENVRWEPWDAPQRVVNDAPALITKPMRKGKRLLYSLRIADHGRFERDGRSFVESADIIGSDE
jgi:hypothetical protein